MSFGKLLKEWMFRLEFNQAELARVTGISTSTISRYMSQERKPSGRTIERIMTFFKLKYGVSEEEFWSLADDGEEIEYATTVKVGECREVSLIEELYETLNNVNRLCEEILEKLEEGKGQK